MELQFEHYLNLGAGINPDAIHLPDNSVMLFSVLDGRLMGAKAELGLIDINWGAVSFPPSVIVTADKSISRMIMKSVPREGVYGVWWQDDNPENDQRHRFAIWLVEDDISDYLNEAVIEHSIENPISTFNLTIENPDKELVGEIESMINPGFKLIVRFAIGDNPLIDMGTFFVDKSDFRVLDGLAMIDSRNIIGKKLKDQTFDAVSSYAIDRLDSLLYSICEDAGISNTEAYIQGPASFNVGMQFPPNMNYLAGINEVLKTSLNWVIKERVDGIVVIGSSLTYAELPQNSTYTFIRGTDVFSRAISRDDSATYAKVCVHTASFGLVANSAVDTIDAWVVSPNKTLYLPVPDDTPQLEMDAYSADIADRLSKAGTIETFIGPFRPQLLVGDEAKITDGADYILGLIVNIKHRFGKSGASTEFVVDSAGRMGKPQIKELIEIITDQKMVGDAKRL